METRTPQQVHFINLTTGIERYKELTQQGITPNFLRIQSTHGEAQNFTAIMEYLDANLLMNLAIGNECIIYDAGSRRDNGCSRVIWQLIPFIQYSLTKLWFQKKNVVAYNIVGNKKLDVTEYYERKFKELPKLTKKRLRYYRKFLLTDKIELHGVYWKSISDGNQKLDVREFIFP